MRTTQERRASQTRGNSGWCRARRNFANLPNSFDDFFCHDPGLDWKRVRETQYRVVQMRLQ